MAANTGNQVTIDIGGSTFTMDFEGQLRKALNHKADFPKELAYTSNMVKWAKIADGSYQTSDEMSIIEATAKEVVSQMPSGTNIIDLGAANSAKYEPYVREFLAQGKTCTYIPLDIENSSLAAQVGRAKAKFPGLASYGIWGSFQHGDDYFKQIPPARLFLSLGSIFYNGPDEVAEERCQNFRRHLKPSDRLIVGQDGPSGLQTTNVTDPYNTKEYKAFFTGYLMAIQAEAGINADVNKAWSFKSMTDNTKHYFNVTAKHDMVCTKYEGFTIKAGTTYQMFKSWKRTEADISQISAKNGLTVKLLGKAKNSGMRQFLVQN
ncbi:hypothetical protein B0T10DRAFT_406931 [Thelonectria olida]|uniref:Histidine-specific methyltransferase SAM-dependent domain-containing protein n=1 Tax=Thelonectria olida TaxID=1576542 RepID=A0A9P8W0S4_9HYPO|nr:hypothetical protein B0T10DRAFT_406931 [Thelonectria olida]